MILLDRKLICDRLKLSRSASYRIVGTARLAQISSDEVVELLNRTRRGSQEIIYDIPSDLMTADELAVGLTESGMIIDAKVIARLTGHKKNTPPHYRLNKQTIRYRLSSFRRWIEQSARTRRQECLLKMGR